MKKTENFELNQWEKADRILMEDFNNDNAKIDAAMAAQSKRLGLELIQSKTVETTFRAADVNLSEISWSEWKTIIIDVVPAAGTSANVNFCYSSIYDVIGRISTKWTRLILCPFGQENAPIFAILWGASPSLFRTDLLTFGGIGNLSIIGDTVNDQVVAGTTITVRGERM